MDPTAVGRFLESVYVTLLPSLRHSPAAILFSSCVPAPPLPSHHPFVDARAILTHWLCCRMDAPSVAGAILIDSKSGLCLGAIGKANQDDAAQLVVASRSACDAQGVGAVELRGSRVVLRLGDGVLVGVWKE